MPIYRSDQAQMTFAVEAAPGGYPELASAVVKNLTGVVATPNGGHLPPFSYYYWL